MQQNDSDKTRRIIKTIIYKYTKYTVSDAAQVFAEPCAHDQSGLMKFSEPSCFGSNSAINSVGLPFSFS